MIGFLKNAQAQSFTLERLQHANLYSVLNLGLGENVNERVLPLRARAA